MHNTEIPIGSRVELRSGCDELYRFAVAGSRGVVRDHKTDELGFPLIYIEWDKDYWRYTGEPDGWTFPTHFRVIEEPPNLLQDQIKKAKARRDEERCPHCGHEQDEAVRRAEEYLDVVQAAATDAVTADGFLIITVNEHPHPSLPGVVVVDPTIYSASMSEEAEQALLAQLAHLAAVWHKRDV